MPIERFKGRVPAYWGPFFGLRGLQDEMNRLFSEFFGEKPEVRVGALTPAVDLVDTGDSVKVMVELPGIKKEDVEISLKDDRLVIRGEKREKKETKEENRYYVERHYGTFSRSLTLPSRVKADKVKANFKDGVLEIILPKVEEEKVKEIQVKVE